MAETDPLLTRSEQRFVVKAGLGLAGVALAWPYLWGIGAVVAAVVLFAVLLFASALEWLLHWGLPTLGAVVVSVLTLRWLFAPKRRAPRPMAPPEDATGASDDALLELERLKAEVEAERTR